VSNSNKSNHTPGPWSYREGGLCWYVEPSSNSKQCLAEVYSKLNSRNENEANARLIAAAPELLEALEIAIIQLDRNGHDLSELGFLKQTLAKVRDES